MLCIVVGPIIYSYAKTQSDCDAAAECINAYPTFYADKYPRLPTCAKFVADAATYGKDLAGTCPFVSFAFSPFFFFSPSPAFLPR